jgi:hypothetical protein
VLLLAPCSAWASPDQNEPAAFLVFPYVTMEPDTPVFVSITNLQPVPRDLHLAYIDGDGSCDACEFTLPIAGRGTRTLVFGSGVTLLGSAQPLAFCPFSRGFVVAFLESGGLVQDQNVLIGRQVFVDLFGGSSFATPALAYQGLIADGDFDFDFDDVEFGRLPRLIATPFRAPNGFPALPDAFDASLVLFTLNFEAGTSPLSDCSLTGIDTDGNQISTSFSFGCWTEVELGSLTPQLEYSQFGECCPPDEQGWLQLDCSVERTPGGPSANGAVQGIIYEEAPSATVLRRNGGGPEFGAEVAWGDGVFQSITSGDAVTFTLPPVIPNAAGSAPADGDR